MRVVLLTLITLVTAGCSLTTPWSVENDLRKLDTLRASAQRSVVGKQYAEAERALEQAVALARPLPDQTKLADTLQQAGELYLLQDKPFKTIGMLREACAIYGKTDNLSEGLKLR